MVCGAHRCAEGLTENSRRAVELRVVLGSSYEEISEALGCTPWRPASRCHGRSKTCATTRSRHIVVIGAIAVVGVGGAAAAAVSTMSSDEVSHGLPGGSMIFQGTNPSCSSGDGIVFQCTLASAPTAEVLNAYTNAAELFVDEHINIAGGCRGQSADGLSWTCDVGQRAVDEAILSADLLGQYSPGPRSG